MNTFLKPDIFCNQTIFFVLAHIERLRHLQMHAIVMRTLCPICIHRESEIPSSSFFIWFYFLRIICDLELIPKVTMSSSAYTTNSPLHVDISIYKCMIIVVFISIMAIYQKVNFYSNNNKNYPNCFHCFEF